jgi:hypothetical protein
MGCTAVPVAASIIKTTPSNAAGDLDERNATVHPVVLAQRSLSFIFLNIADLKGICRGQDLREAQTDFET